MRNFQGRKMRLQKAAKIQGLGIRQQPKKKKRKGLLSFLNKRSVQATGALPNPPDDYSNDIPSDNWDPFGDDKFATDQPGADDFIVDSTDDIFADTVGWYSQTTKPALTGSRSTGRAPRPGRRP